MILAGWQERVFSGVGRRLRDIILDRRGSVGHFFWVVGGDWGKWGWVRLVALFGNAPLNILLTSSM